MAVNTFTASGAKATTPAKLDKAVFEAEVTNHELLKSVYLAYLGNGRQNLAIAKTRGDVSGGGKKPWRQKGTGRARFGSSRNPIWRGGGAAFGPTGNENYSKKVSTASKRKAAVQALSLASKAGKICVVEAIAVKDGKTSQLKALLNKIEVTKSTLLVVESKTPELVRAAANLADVKVVQSKYVNVYNVLNADHVVFTAKALEEVSGILGGAK